MNESQSKQMQGLTTLTLLPDFQRMRIRTLRTNTKMKETPGCNLEIRPRSDSHCQFSIFAEITWPLCTSVA